MVAIAPGRHVDQILALAAGKIVTAPTSAADELDAERLPVLAVDRAGPP